MGVPGRSDDGGRDELPECCPTRVSRSRTRSSNRTIVARSSTTSACKVATKGGITQQNVHRNPPGTLPRHDPVNGYWRTEGCAHSVPGQRGQSVRRKKLRARRLASRRGMLVGAHLVKRSRWLMPPRVPKLRRRLCLFRSILRSP